MNKWVWSVGGMMMMVGEWNFSTLEKNLSQCNFVHNKLHMDWQGTEPRPLLLQAGNKLPEPWHSL
jgi:hypothetical protein